MNILHSSVIYRMTKLICQAKMLNQRRQIFYSFCVCVFFKQVFCSANGSLPERAWCPCMYTLIFVLFFFFFKESFFQHNLSNKWTLSATTFHQQREIIALHRQMTWQRPESPTVTTLGMRVNTTYVKSTKGAFSYKHLSSVKICGQFVLMNLGHWLGSTYEDLWHQPATELYLFIPALG